MLLGACTEYGMDPQKAYIGSLMMRVTNLNESHELPEFCCLKELVFMYMHMQAQFLIQEKNKTKQKTKKNRKKKEKTQIGRPVEADYEASSLCIAMYSGTCHLQ